MRHCQVHIGHWKQQRIRQLKTCVMKLYWWLLVYLGKGCHTVAQGRLLNQCVVYQYSVIILFNMSEAFC